MSPEVKERIESAIKSDKVVVFMKGTPEFPQCGFSAATAQCFQRLGVKFNHVNVLEDFEIREGIKEYSNWPTIPQVYIQGEFIGGCDITREMYANGELKKLCGV